MRLAQVSFYNYVSKVEVTTITHKHLLLLYFIRTVENELQKIDKILESLEGKSAAGYESWRRAQAVQKQRDNKVHMITQ